MRRKDFIKIAGAFSAEYADAELLSTPEQYDHAAEIIHGVQARVEQCLIESNPRFDRDRFRDYIRDQQAKIVADNKNIVDY